MGVYESEGRIHEDAEDLFSMTAAYASMCSELNDVECLRERYRNDDVMTKVSEYLSGRRFIDVARLAHRKRELRHGLFSLNRSMEDKQHNLIHCIEEHLLDTDAEYCALTDLETDLGQCRKENGTYMKHLIPAVQVGAIDEAYTHTLLHMTEAMKRMAERIQERVHDVLCDAPCEATHEFLATPHDRWYNLLTSARSLMNEYASLQLEVAERKSVRVNQAMEDLSGQVH